MTQPSSAPNGADNRLDKGVDLLGVIALGLGTAVGVAIFSIISPAAHLAGPGMLFSVAIAALPMFVIAVTYAFMGSALPTSGASYEWPRRFIHPFVGFLIAWLRLAGSVSAMLVLALVMVQYLSMVVPLPTRLTMLVAFSILFGVNYLGIKVAARLQTVLMAALVVLFLIFAAWGAQHADAANFEPLLPHGWQGVLAAMPLLVTLFFGIEAATEVGEEVKNGQTAIPLGIGLTILSAVSLYLLVAAVVIGVVGAATLGASNTPLLDAAQAFMGPVAKPLIVGAGVVAIGKSLNAIYIILSRNLFAMGRSGILSPRLASIHPRFHTPHVALTVAFGACALGVLLPMTVTGLFLAVSIPTLLKYAGTSVSAAQVVRYHPEIYAQARFRFSPPVMRVWAFAGAIAAVVIVALGTQTDWRPYIALSIWAALGILYYLIKNARSAAEA